MYAELGGKLTIVAEESEEEMYTNSFLVEIGNRLSEKGRESKSSQSGDFNYFHCRSHHHAIIIQCLSKGSGQTHSLTTRIKNRTRTRVGNSFVIFL